MRRRNSKANFEIRDGVLLDCKNLIETAKYSYSRSPWIQANFDGADATADKLVAEVMQHIHDGAAVSGQIFPLAAAWCVLDAAPPGSKGEYGGKDISEARWKATFFVRLGREPSLHVVDDSD